MLFNVVFNKITGLFTKNELRKNITILLKGSILAQALPFICMPILTRLYSPDDFGLFTLYLSIVLSFSAILGLRYDYGILLPKQNLIAWKLLKLAQAIILLISIILGIISIIFQYEISILLSDSRLQPWLILVGINLLAVGLTQSGTLWLNRIKNYTAISNQRILQSSFTNGSQITIGLCHSFGVSGLIIGNLIGQFIGLLYTLRMIKKQSPIINPKLLKSINRKLLVHYRNLPLYNAPTAIIDALRLNGINILLALFFNTGVVGQFSLAWRLLQSPISLINGALSQVYYQHFVELPSHELPKFLSSCIKKSIFIGLIPFGSFFLVSEFLFTSIFGETWRLAGVICKLLTPWLFLNFITSPISSIFLVLHKEKLLLLFSAFYMAIPLSIIYFVHNNIYQTVLLVSTSMSVLLIFFLLIAYSTANNYAKR